MNFSRKSSTPVRAVLMMFLVMTAMSFASHAQTGGGVKLSEPVDKQILKAVFAKRQNSPFMVTAAGDDLLNLSPGASASARTLAPTGPCDTAVAIVYGQTVAGALSSADCRLDDGSYADFYAFSGTAGQQVTINLSSDAFDSYLGLASADGTVIAEDDDGGGGLNSRIVATLPATGTYIILANSALPNQFGGYTLSLSATNPCLYALSPTSATVPASGGNFSFTVVTPSGCQWGASIFDNAFITVTSGSGTGPGTVSYFVQANGNETPRTGTIVVANQRFTVNQAANVCTYSITPANVSLPAAQSSGSFTVNAPAGCYWRTSSNDSFISYNNGGGAYGTGTVNYTVGTNNGGERTGTITAGGQTFTIAQAGLNCTFSITPTSLTVNHLEHTGTVSIVTQPGCAWSVGRTEWILIDTIDATGSGSFSYRILENVGTVSRSSGFAVGGTNTYVRVFQTGTAYKTRFDYDGDGKSDVSVFRPSNGVWYLLDSETGYTGYQFGTSTDKIVPADYDGDGKTDVAVYRDGDWFVLKSGTLSFASYHFGTSSDTPMPADYNGDGKAELAVFRPSDATWYQLNTTTNAFSSTGFGQTGDVPVAADYDGDGKTDIAVYRPSNGIWYLNRSRDGYIGYQFGISTDKPVPGDYDGDGKTDVAVFRPSEGNWFVLKSSNFGFASQQFGLVDDIPAPADYDGDGKTDFAVFRGGNWYQLRSGSGFTAVLFGQSGDVPTPAAYVR